MVIRVVLFSLFLSSVFSYQYHSPEGDKTEESAALVQMPILCPPGSALLGFNLEETETGTIRFGYDCYESDLIDLKGEKVMYTKWEPTDTKIMWVAEHLMECEEGYVLRGFQMEKVRSEVGRFRYNCYPMKTEECQSGLPVSTGWYEIDGSISSLKSAGVKNYCKNCPLKGVQMFVKKTESINYNSWRYEWCLVRDEF